MRNFYVIW